MSSARTYDAALPLPSVFVAKMKSVNDCLNMTETIISNPRLTRGKIRAENQSLHEDLEFYASKGSYEGTPHRFFDEEGVAAMHYIGGRGNSVHTFPV